MPAEDDIHGLKTTYFWRVFLGFPLFFVLFAFILIFFVIKHDTPKFNLSKGNDKGALESIKMCYHPSENHQEILDFMKKNCSFTTDSVSYKGAMCDKKYYVPTYLMIGMIFLIAMNGTMFFNTYGEILLDKMFTKPTSGWVTVGTVLNLQLAA